MLIFLFIFMIGCIFYALANTGYFLMIGRLIQGNILFYLVFYYDSFFLLLFLSSWNPPKSTLLIMSNHLKPNQCKKINSIGSYLLIFMSVFFCRFW